MTTRRIPPRALALALCLSFSACTPEDVDHWVPDVPDDMIVEVGPVVVAVEDTFTLQGGAATPYTAVREFGWGCTDDQVNIILADGLVAGSFRLEVRDGAGTLVHDNTFRAAFGGAVQGVTRPGGVPGLWSLRFTFTAAKWTGSFVLKADTNDDSDKIVIDGGYAMNGHLHYDVGWPSGPAEVKISEGLAFGWVGLRIKDGAGVVILDQVFLAPLVATYDGVTVPGVAGTWSVDISIFGSAAVGHIRVSH